MKILYHTSAGGILQMVLLGQSGQLSPHQLPTSNPRFSDVKQPKSFYLAYKSGLTFQLTSSIGLIVSFPPLNSGRTLSGQDNEAEGFEPRRRHLKQPKPSQSALLSGQRNETKQQQRADMRCRSHPTPGIQALLLSQIYFSFLGKRSCCNCDCEIFPPVAHLRTTVTYQLLY